MWEIYAYQNADSLFGVFNACAAIHASGYYASAVAAVAFCGFVAALLAYAFAPEKLQGWKWLASVTLVVALLIVPKVSVGIIDKTGGAPVKVVDNVPLGVALLGSVTSTIGHTLTGLFETAFQQLPGNAAQPQELRYEQHGLMFGNRLVRETAAVVFQDPGFRTDLINFIHNCTTYDLLDGTLDATTFSASSDVWPLMGTPNPARFTTVSSLASSGGGGSGMGIGIDTCPNVYQVLQARLPAQLTRVQGRLAFQLNPTLPAAAAASVIAAQIQQAYLRNSIADAAASAADIVRQNAMLNVIQDSATLVGQKVNDPAAMVLAVGRAQAVAQKNASWLNYGKVAEQALPVLRNVIEAVAYAMFPLFVLLLLMTSGRETMLAFKGYAGLLIWIQLWPPLYAILNYMASVYAAYDLAAAADLGTGAKALSLQTASSIYSRAISGEAVVGYLSISIPFIAWAALKRMETVGTALVGGLSGLQAALSGATSSAAVGNTSMGNVAMDQLQLSPNRSSAFMNRWQDDLSGDTFTAGVLGGRTAVSLLRNQGYASRVVSSRVSEQDVQDASRQVAAARSESVSALQERSAVLAESFTKGLAKLHASRSATGTTTSGFEQYGENLNRLDQISKSVADTTGFTQSQSARIALGAAARLGVSTPLAGLQGNVAADKSYLSSLSKAEQRVVSAMTNEQLSEFKQFGDRVSRDRSFATLVSSDAREARELAARLSASASRSERADATLVHSTAVSERMARAYERGETIAIDIAQDPHNVAMFTRFAQRYGGTSASAMVLMDAELARQSPRPHRVFSNGASVPGGAADVRRAHEQDRESTSLRVDPRAMNDSHRQAVERASWTEQSPKAPPQTRSRRTEFQQAGTSVRDRVDDAAGSPGSQPRAGATADGTLRSSESLLSRSAKQVAADAGSVIDDATKAVKRALDD
ncbi:conjugal transfer protein TraG N-terminal domain-containing protein [Roseateles chitinivorans]|uniref:conjugal transfer protein TraG N-terminal domain-containing protein n=1 Tax=Roseateles chitinivorans TaxID=2917965 RepID=UPI003D6749A0